MNIEQRKLVITNNKIYAIEDLSMPEKTIDKVIEKENFKWSLFRRIRWAYSYASNWINISNRNFIFL